MWTCLTVGKFSNQDFVYKELWKLSIRAPISRFPLKDDFVPFGIDYLIVKDRPI